MKSIIYFLLLQVIIFSETKKLREITFYEYYPVIAEKIKSGMEIQKIKGYCVVSSENECFNFLYVPKDKEGGALAVNSIKKINIDLSNFKVLLSSNVIFEDSYPYFDSKKQITLKDKNMKQKILNIQKMLIDDDKFKKTEISDAIRAEDEENIPIDELRKIFSTYIVIKLPELSSSYTLDYNFFKIGEKSKCIDSFHYELNKKIVELVDLLETY